MLLQVEADQFTQKADSLKNVATGFVADLKEDPTTTLQTLGQDALNLGLKVLAAIVIYIIGAWLIKRIKIMMAKSFEKRNTEKAIASFTTSLVSITLTILLIVIVIGTLGINTTSIAALLAAGGMAIGMALSGTVQNFAGGIMLLVFKPFKAGDFIEAQGYCGTVTEVNIVSTKLVTTDNRIIVIPNGALSSGNIDNYSQKAVRRLEFRLPLSHGTDAKACIELLGQIVAKDSRVINSTTPEAADPFIVVSGITKDNVEVMVRVWTKAEDYWPLNFDLNQAFYTELPKAGFNFAAARYEIGKN